MRRNSWSVLLSLVAVVGLVLGSQTVGAQGKPEGKIVRSHREDQGGGRPAWVETALGRALGHLKANGAAHGLRDADKELVLHAAQEDDLGLTHIRLGQVKEGVPVFAGQLIAHLDASNVREISGRVFGSDIDTKPALNAAQAEKAAKDALGYNGELANQPQANLVVLPDEYSRAGALLTYQVELLVEDGTDATGRYEYFIDANTGSVVHSYNNMHKTDVVGTNNGNSLYSGDVSINTDKSGKNYYLRDLTRGGMYVVDMNNCDQNFGCLLTNGSIFTDQDNIWGNNATSSRQSVAIDAHFGAGKTWDYYLGTHGRRGIDGNGYRVVSRVHYGRSYNNAFWNGTNMTYGDGDGVTFRPLVSLDVVGHEITHGLTEKTAGLVYEKESGALNESFSDIFGTAIEFYANGVGGRPGDFFIGEDIQIQADINAGFRNMQDPTEDGDPGHYASRLYPEPCTPSEQNDQCGVHSNSGISNKAFYLLAQGSTTNIGITKAEKIFYRALTVYLTPSSNFSAARAATLRSAGDLYGIGSAEYNATANAWTAVGVQ